MELLFAGHFASKELSMVSPEFAFFLESIEVYEKEWTGGRRKKRSTVKTRIFGGRIPTALINEIHEFKGSNTYHLERALRLYVKVMKARPGKE